MELLTLVLYVKTHQKKLQDPFIFDAKVDPSNPEVPQPGDLRQTCRKSYAAMLLCGPLGLVLWWIGDIVATHIVFYIKIHS